MRWCFFSQEAKEEMAWWKSNIGTAYNDIEVPSDPQFVIFSDASTTGWGCLCEDGRTGGHWRLEEADQSINVIELKAAFFALQTFASDKRDIHVRLMSDNTTAVACINKMGTSHSEHCNKITKDIWLFCKNRGLWISAAFIPGKQNVEADEESRDTNFDTEWQINSELLRHALD